jgi:hypothetical protein
MSSTQDNVVFNYGMSKKAGHSAEKPFVNKEMIYVIDNNGGPNYSRNQVEFETVTLSNGGKWVDYKNGYISIPTVTILESADADVDSVRFKNSFLNLIDSITVDYGNNNVVQQSANISPYLVFKQHMALSGDDLVLNDHTGYRKDTNDSWSYTATEGITNNLKATNKGFDKQALNVMTTPQKLVLSDANVRSAGMDYYKKTNNEHVYYHDAIIRLKDLLFFESMPIIKGSNIKITINLNQSSVTTNRAGGIQDTDMNASLKGSVCPVMRLDPKNGAETLSCQVVTNGAHVHEKKQCRLYVPTYELNDSFKNEYSMLNQQKVLYEDVFVKMYRNNSGNFQHLLTNAQSRIQQLVIVPMLSKTSNGTRTKMSPQESIYSTEPSTCSPCLITDFNVKLSGTSIYRTNQVYKYETFINEVNVGGINANQQDGLCSGQISLKDYSNNYGYIVCDISRRVAGDENTPFSVEIQGNIKSGLDMDFLCYLTYSKDCTLDLVTGQKID